jgi:hypothetical protein
VLRAVATVDGVVRVVNRLGYDIDDLSSPHRCPAPARPMA